MKPLISLFLLLVFFQGMAQSKKDMEKQLEQKTAQVDTLTKANADLTRQVDSLSKNLEVYMGLYTVIKEKVLMKDFEPARFDEIVDSVRTTRDSAHKVSLAPMQGLKDSLALARKENLELKGKVDELTAITADKSKLVAELKDLKSLLDAKVITQTEYDEKKRLVMDRWK